MFAQNGTACVHEKRNRNLFEDVMVGVEFSCSSRHKRRAAEHPTEFSCWTQRNGGGGQPAHRAQIRTVLLVSTHCKSGSPLKSSYPEPRPTELKKNRFYAAAGGRFVDATGTFSGITVVDTFGCSGSQIVEATGTGAAHLKFGVTRSLLLDWIGNSVIQLLCRPSDGAALLTTIGRRGPRAPADLASAGIRDRGGVAKPEGPP